MESPGSSEGLPPEEVNLLDAAIVLAKHKLLLIAVPFGAAVLAAIYALLLPIIFTATARILPPQQSQSSAYAMLGQLGALAGLGGGSFGIRQPNDLYIGMLKSRTVADRLIERFDLKEVFGAKTLDKARKDLAGRSHISSGKDGLIKIEVDDVDPKRAAALANAYIEELYRLTQTLAVTEASQRRLFFEKQLAFAKRELADAEVSLKATQEKTGLIQLGEQGKAIIDAVVRLRAQITAKEVQLAAMRVFATENNPEFVIAQKELAGLRIQLAKTEKNAEASQGDIFVPTGKVPEAGLEYVRKLRDVKYYETMFELLAKQYEVAKIDEAKDTSLIQIVDTAIEPEERSRPARTRIVLLISFLAGVLAVILAFVVEAARRVRENPRQAEQLHVLRRYLWGR